MSDPRDTATKMVIEKTERELKTERGRKFVFLGSSDMMF